MPTSSDGCPPSPPLRRFVAPERHGMTARPIPTRHWRSYGTDPLSTGREALAEPFRAFPSWFMRITCDRCGQQRMFSETHSAQRDMLIRLRISGECHHLAHQVGLQPRQRDGIRHGRWFTPRVRHGHRRLLGHPVAPPVAFRQHGVGIGLLLQHEPTVPPALRANNAPFCPCPPATCPPTGDLCCRDDLGELTSAPPTSAGQTSAGPRRIGLVLRALRHETDRCSGRAENGPGRHS